MKSNKESLGGTAEERKDRSSYNELPEATEDSSPSKAVKKESRKGNKENRELRILRRSKTLKEKNDPDRFSGDGINFKAKIIGTEHVFDARGNRMCQGALQRLKAAVKTSGDHKQRIILNISLKGIIIKDEKSGETLHHHPIHKISFISQDVNDNRAFGYVFGCPQTGHDFFGIKTEKIASQVVFTLRDLFLTALEIKKKEIENAIESQKEEVPDEEDTDKAVSNGVDNAAASNGADTFSNGYNKDRGLHDELLYSNVVSIPDERECENEKENSSHPEPAVDTLLDLQFSMDSLQQGISQMDHSIASAATQQFGISFSEDDVSESSGSSIPMSFHFKLDKLSSLYQETLSISSRSSSTSDYTVGAPENKAEEVETLKRDLSASLSSANSEQNVGTTWTENSPVASCSQPTPPVPASVPDPVEDKYAVFHDIDQLPSIFDNPDLLQLAGVVESSFSLEESSNEVYEEVQSEMKTSTPIVFAELDPLGNHPYVDKKDFFQDLKTPPKKVLKDLVSSSELFPSSINNLSTDAFSNSGDSKAELFQHSSESSVEIPVSSDSNGLGLEQNQKEFNPFVCGSNNPVSRIPPKLPPKRSISVANAFAAIPDVARDTDRCIEDPQWEVRNPFNPFVISDYPDVPPPSSPPPPPPPRLPTKVSNEILSIMSTPPPRPPSRSNGVPTPPLPKRRSPFAASSQTWFSFDQEALSLQSAATRSEPEYAFDQFAPPIPSPARKFPPMPKIDPPLLKSSSASNSPATMRRLSNQSPQFSNSSVQEDTIEQLKPIASKVGSPRKVLSRHSSLMQESEAFTNCAFPPVPEAIPPVELSIDSHKNNRSSPPLPPKPVSISRPRPSPSKKLLASAFTGASVSSSNPSATESSNGTHSSSSLVFSTSDDGGLMGSSAEAIFLNSGEHSDVFSQSSLDKTRQSSRSPPAKDPSCELSPDSIFRRKSDPFADEFFMTLPKKSTWIASSVAGDSVEKSNYSNGVEVCYEDLKTPT